MNGSSPEIISKITEINYIDIYKNITLTEKFNNLKNTTADLFNKISHITTESSKENFLNTKTQSLNKNFTILKNLTTSDIQFTSKNDYFKFTKFNHSLQTFQNEITTYTKMYEIFSADNKSIENSTNNKGKITQYIRKV